MVGYHSDLRFAKRIYVTTQMLKIYIFSCFKWSIGQRPFFIQTSAQDKFSISEIEEVNTIPSLFVHHELEFYLLCEENCG